MIRFEPSRSDDRREQLNDILLFACIVNFTILKVVGSTEVIFKKYVLFSVYSDWLRVNHLSFSKQRKGSGFLDIFSRQ